MKSNRCAAFAPTRAPEHRVNVVSGPTAPLSLVCMLLLGSTAWAQSTSEVSAAPRPPSGRIYGTPRPPGYPGAPPPPSAMPRPPYPPPPGMVAPPYYRPPGYRPPNVGIVVGPVWPRPWGYGYPYAYPGYPYPAYPAYAPGVVVTSPTIVTSPPAVTYVERTDQVEAPAAGYWYWCASPAGWYPEVGECPGGWQPVAPRTEQ